MFVSLQKRRSLSPRLLSPHPKISLPVVRVLAESPIMSLSANASLTTQSIEAQIAGLRYVDKPRVARDVLGLIRNSNSLLIKIQPFGQKQRKATQERKRQQVDDGPCSDSSLSCVRCPLVFAVCPVHANGTSETLLCLTGTTPIYYKNAQYNIPITLWLGDQYPHRPPSCFVTPTRDMRIKDGHLHVDHFGTIYLPYLNQWSAATSNLLEMVTIMSSVFSQDPPVFKVPANAPPQQQSQPSPVVQQQPQQPQPMQMQPSPHHQQQQQQPVVQQAPFLSPSHLQQSPQQPQYNNPYVLGAASPPIPPRTVSSASAASASSSAAQQQSPYSMNGVSPSPAPPVPIDPRAQKKSQLVAQLTLKLRQHLTDDLSLKTLLMDDLVQSQQAVDAHTATITESLSSLSAELAQVQHASQSVQAQNEELQRWLEQHEKREIPEVDRMCFVKDTWSKQSVGKRGGLSCAGCDSDPFPCAACSHLSCVRVCFRSVSFQTPRCGEFRSRAGGRLLPVGSRVARRSHRFGQLHQADSSLVTQAVLCEMSGQPDSESTADATTSAECQRRRCSTTAAATTAAAAGATVTADAGVSALFLRACSRCGRSRTAASAESSSESVWRTAAAAAVSCTAAQLLAAAAGQRSRRQSAVVKAVLLLSATLCSFSIRRRLLAASEHTQTTSCIAHSGLNKAPRIDRIDLGCLRRPRRDPATAERRSARVVLSRSHRDGQGERWQPCPRVLGLPVASRLNFSSFPKAWWVLWTRR